MDLSMTQKQIQTQNLSPQMLQSMKILQMSSQELLEYIRELAKENPVMEAENSDEDTGKESDLQRKLEWLESTDVQNRSYYRQEVEKDPIVNYGVKEQDDGDLYSYLLSQLQSLDLETHARSAAEFIVESLNGSGWLEDDILTLAKSMGLPYETMEKALEIVQSFEPAGIAGRSLSECLSLQIRRQGGSALALRISEECLEQLSKNRYQAIEKQLGAAPDEVREACAFIRTLNPRPGAGFATREILVYVKPDIIVDNSEDHYKVQANDDFSPKIGLNKYYCGLLQTSDSDEVKEYLTEKIKQAMWVIRCIEQRRTTLFSCAECILRLQEVFFRLGPGHLRPMTQSDVAAMLDVHESTVSRAIKGKYIQCAYGVYPLGYFFSRGLGSTGKEVSSDKARSLLKELIDGEDKKKPLSDQKLCSLMLEKGVELSRRTVAKYRDGLCIPNASARRQY